MGKFFESENNEWGLSISYNKNQKPANAPKPPSTLKVVIGNPKAGPKSSKIAATNDEVSSFIAKSKAQVNLNAIQLIEKVKEWQENTIQQFDMIQQSIVRAHNLQNKSTTDDNRKTKRPIAAPTKPPTPVGPSMPVLVLPGDETEDDIGKFLTKPPVVARKKIQKRRNTVDFTCDPNQDTLAESVPVRKMSRTIHSSVLAMSGESSKNTAKTQSKLPMERDLRKSTQLTPTKQTSSSKLTKKEPKTSDGKVSKSIRSQEQPKQLESEANNVFKKYMEARKIIMAAKQKQQEDEAKSKSEEKKSDKNAD